MLKLDDDDPRIAKSNKTYVGLKANNMGFDAHLTVFYLGEITQVQEQLARRVLEDFDYSYPNQIFYVERENISMFGPNNDIPVLTVMPMSGALERLRDMFADHAYLPNPSEFDWNPHITIKFKYGAPIILPGLIELTNLGLY